MTTTLPEHESGNVSGIIIFGLLGPRERVTGYMYPPIPNALASHCMPILAVLCYFYEVPGLRTQGR